MGLSQIIFKVNQKALYDGDEIERDRDTANDFTAWNCKQAKALRGCRYVLHKRVCADVISRKPWRDANKGRMSQIDW